MPWDTLWNDVLAWLGQVITPDWNDVIGWLPSLTFILLVLFFLDLAHRWRAERSRNASRLPAPRKPAPPAGVHIPGGSLWPFLLPIGAAVLLFGLVDHPARIGTPTLDASGIPTPAAAVDLAHVFNLPIMGLGILIGLIGIVGWYRDAGHEWHHTDHPQLAVAPALPAPSASGPPPGVHLPGPSPWPFFVPIAMAVILFGLIFSPALVVGGLLMGAIAASGWYRDANHELRQIQAGQPAAEPRTRDPHRAFPTALVGVYAAIGVVAVALTFAPQTIDFVNATPAPSTAAPEASGGAATSAVKISAKDLRFSLSTITVAADKPFTITFDNEDSVPHNVAIFEGRDATGKNVFRGTIDAGPKTLTYDVPALPAGTYYFHCDVHPTMNGTLISK
ncbi:MAG TPA: cupredoxin domain-containing protein [Candidatus Limnocylindrales bacterium]|jgi:plastocyanin|nr:cupredoxin domain-containing protein [Candidatus Limnocylindrales bacterium]